MIGVVALIVIGPEKLPRVARTVGHLAGRLQRYVADVKADINREIELEELRKMRDSMQEASKFETSVQSELNKTETELNRAVEGAAVERAVEEKKPEQPKPAVSDQESFIAPGGAAPTPVRGSARYWRSSLSSSSIPARAPSMTCSRRS